MRWAKRRARRESCLAQYSISNPRLSSPVSFAGFLPAYLHIRSELESEFPPSLVVITGAAPPKLPAKKFEVTVDGKLIHSYINGDGMVDREWKLFRIFDAVEEAIEVRKKEGRLGVGGRDPRWKGKSMVWIPFPKKKEGDEGRE